MVDLTHDPEFMDLLKEADENLKKAEELIRIMKAAGFDVSEHEKTYRETKTRIRALKRALGIE